jgi:lipoprotein-anchoring transpeptidase ErfK/SrfK
VLTTLAQFRSDFHPRTVLALAERRNAAGQPTWYRISVPGRPNGRTGWIPAAAARLQPVDRWLVVYRGSRKFELYVDGRLRRTGPVAVGARGMETPVGLFYVQSRFVPSKYPILGAFAFETSGYSKLSDWPGGGVVGVHGTNTPWLIGQAVSHGCVRLRNSDVLALRRLVRVGTPVKIVAS